ncbi:MULTISPECIES: histidinol-phosphate transaminase [unclassified Fusibacter]|uniref:pyridoxal phosphate-dependent aminotransferase n=1 Tax=unclassified Fusibacter TaxID=2624464 RepID=UPI001011AA4D|nr:MULTISPECIES: histidinol-phosphate transaminase [unclassified Fusibacter]MCK8058846.1 histidinol-phosphate aminotransferase family protein [Fusibacter sp. A2]NPE21920.1 histidinol-phosphate aminotransferase family protein [Fusibacter sp. A1]RXV61490.1 histidinol-phosphate aminotransferase family protein [Fusibacter sp. A1]
MKLNANENPFTRQIDMISLNPEWINRYPDAAYPDLLDRLSAYTGVDQERLVLGNGSDELLDMLCRSLFENGDQVMTLSPSFGEYDRYLAINGLKQLKVVPDLELLNTSVDRIIFFIKKHRPKGFILCNPNNPTGQLYSKEDLHSIISVLPSDSYLILDEAYVEFVNQDVSVYLEDDKRIITVRTLSKAFGLAGLRIGYTIVSSTVRQLLTPYLSPYRIGNFSAQLACKQFDLNEMRRHVKAMLVEKQKLMTALSTVDDIRTVACFGNFVWLHSRDAQTLRNYLSTAGVKIRSFVGALDDYLRISIGTESEIDELIRLIKEMDPDYAKNH